MAITVFFLARYTYNTIKKLKKKIPNVNKLNLMYIWLWFFTMFSTTLWFHALVNDNLEFIFKNKINTLPILFLLLIFASVINYIGIRTFNGSVGEAFVTGFSSLGTPLLYNYGIEIMKKEQEQENNQSY